MGSFFCNGNKETVLVGHVDSLLGIDVEIGESLEGVENTRFEPNLILRSSLRRARRISSDGG
jgi:hypothetical protein